MKKLLFVIVIIGFVVSSCDVLSFDDDINKNPNLPSAGEPSQLIANAMLSLPSLSSSQQGEYYGQYLTKIVYVDKSLYKEGTTSFYSLYQGPLINLQKAIENTENENEKAVAEILKAYYFWNITDRWGDIPYTEALDGEDDFTPAYDKQEDIYNDLFKQLKQAGEQLNINGELSNDIIYHGDIKKWRKFSNTVRMLMALRLSEVDEAKAEQEFNDALSDGVMESNDDSFIFQHLSEQNNENYWYDQIVRQTRVWWALPTRLIDMMEPYDDPRLSVYGNPAVETGEFDGLEFWTPESEIGNADNYALIGSAIYEQDAPVYLTTYAQAEFARAEAAARGWITEDAESHYNQAVEASVKQWTGSDEGTDQLIQKQSFDSNAPIEQIAKQRYIHLYMFGYEAWAEYRRTGFPDNMVKPKGRDVPLRLAYPSDEALNNNENFNEAIDRQFGGENTIRGRIWWDVD